MVRVQGVSRYGATGSGDGWVGMGECVVIEVQQVDRYADAGVGGVRRWVGMGWWSPWMILLHLSLSQPQPQPTEPQPNVFIVFISLNKDSKRPYTVYTDKMCFY